MINSRVKLFWLAFALPLTLAAVPGHDAAFAQGKGERQQKEDGPPQDNGGGAPQETPPAPEAEGQQSEGEQKGPGPRGRKGRNSEQSGPTGEDSGPPDGGRKGDAGRRQGKQRDPGPGNDNAEQQKQLDEQRAKAAAEKQQQREAEKAARQKQQEDQAAAKAKADTEKQLQIDAAKAKAEADKAKSDADEQKRLEAEKAKADAGKAKAAAEEQKQKDAEKAKADAEQQQQRDAGKAKADAEKQQRDAERAKAEADKQKEADRQKQEADRAKAVPEQAPSQAPPQTQTQDVPAKGDGRDGARRTQPRVEPANEKQAEEQLKQERAKADAEFEKAKQEAAQQPPPPDAKDKGGPQRERRRDADTKKFEDVRKQRQERVEDGGKRQVIQEPDKRTIVIEKDRTFVRHDETNRFGRTGKELRRERQKDGTTLIVNLSIGGFEILTLQDDDGRLLRRSRRGSDGREIVLVDNRRIYRSRPRGGFYDAYVDLPPPVIRIPRNKYIVDYDGASEDDIYEALIAPPVERLDRGYALDEVRQSRWLRDRMRRVDLNAINFAFASWDVDESEYGKLEHVADAMKRIIDRNPDEMFLIEGHTDAVGSDIDNLSLSDRRAESVAIILSDTFRVPPENLATQGYGEQYLKVETEGPSWENRRVAVRRITPLLSRAE